MKANRTDETDGTLTRAVPVAGVGVETRNLQGPGLGLVGHLVDQHPLLVLSHHTHLKPTRRTGIGNGTDRVSNGDHGDLA